MAKGKKRVTTVTEEVDQELEAVPTGPLAEMELPPDDDALEVALGELVEGASSFTVFRLPAIGQTGRRTFCATYRAGDLGEQGICEFVAERLGGGRYLIAGRGERGAILGNQTIEIDRSIKAKTEAAEPVRDTTKSELVELVREVLRERGGGGSSNPAEMTAAIVQSAATQAASIIGIMQPLIQQMAENTKPQTPPWETLTRMLEIGAEMRGDGENGGGPASYIPLVEKFANILDRATARGTVPGQRRQIKPADKTETPSPVATNPNEPGWMKGLRPYIPIVLQQAKDDVPPDFFLGELEERAPRVVGWLSEQNPETWPAELVGYAPELAPYAGWIKQLLEAIGDDDDAPPTDGPVGL